MLDLKAHLKTMVEAHAPSGHEEDLRHVLHEEWQNLTDDMQQDGLGSLIGVKYATVPTESPRKIMLAAHMDEIGMLVRDIVEGFIYVQDISGMDNRVMMAQPVMVHGKKQLPGIVATTPPHLLSPEMRKKYPPFDSLVIDVGLPADEVKELVNIGDIVTLDVPMLELQNKRVAGKAMDDRACIAAITVCLDALQFVQHSWDVYATATAQEETGLYGAATAAHKINPDIAIALDVGFAEQPGVKVGGAVKMGGGPLVGIGPNFHDKLREKLMETAEYHEIKVNTEPTPRGSGTDAWAIQVACEGIPTLLISIPIRNMHSPVETLDLADIERAGRLLAHFITRLDEDFMTAIDWDDYQELESDET